MGPASQECAVKEFVTVAIIAGLMLVVVSAVTDLRDAVPREEISYPMLGSGNPDHFCQHCAMVCPQLDFMENNYE